MPKPKVHSIRVQYVNGQFFELTNYDIEKLEAMQDAMNILERAKRVYENLEPLFLKEKEIK